MLCRTATLPSGDIIADLHHVLSRLLPPCTDSASLPGSAPVPPPSVWLRLLHGDVGVQFVQLRFRQKRRFPATAAVHCGAALRDPVTVVTTCTHTHTFTS